MAQRKRQYRIRRWTEYIVQSYVQDDNGEWEYETNVEVVTTRKEAEKLTRDYKAGKNLPREFAWHLEYEARNAASTAGTLPSDVPPGGEGE